MLSALILLASMQTTYILDDIQYILCSEPYSTIQTVDDVPRYCRYGLKGSRRYKYGPYLIAGVVSSEAVVLIDSNNTTDLVKFLKRNENEEMDVSNPVTNPDAERSRLKPKRDGRTRYPEY